MEAASGSSSSRSAANERASRTSSSRGRERDAAASEMHMSIDSQSFVNLGQLMGSRHGTAGGGGGNSNTASPGGLVDDFGTCCLSDDDDSEGLRDFDQIFHPRAEQGGSTSSAWSGRALYGRRGSATDGDDDDDESLLPALPSRSTTPGSPRGADSGSGSSSNKPSFPSADAEPGWDEEDFESDSMSEGGGVSGARGGGRGQDFPSGLLIDMTCAATADASKVAVMTPETQRASLDADDSSDDVEGSTTATTTTGTAGVEAQPSSEAAAAEAASSITPSFLRDSWLHVPTEREAELDGASTEANATAVVVDGPGDAARIDPQRQRYYDAAAAAARARRAAAVALADCGECVVRAVDKASAAAASRVQQVAQVVKQQVEAGADACARGQQAVVKAVDNVPQAPVRMWLVRIAGSLVIGAVLGGAASYYALPRAMTGPASPCTAAGSGGGSAGTTSPWWDAGRDAGAGEPGEGTEQSFGDRLNRALFAARAGEAAAQQVLLEEVRNILAATGKSGGISAEQILRQFNARRFKEASKAWSAAEGSSSSSSAAAGAGSDPLDSLFFAPPSTPTIPQTNPSASPPPSSSSSSSSQQQQHQHQQQHQQHQPQQQPFIPEGAAPATECAGGASGSAFCSPDGAGGDVGARIYAARVKVQQQHRRRCSGAWVC